MFVHFGNHYYGKVDVVPNLCYVATRFFHVNFVPLVPLGSCIIVAGSEKGNNFQGIQTSLSLKSIFVAWLRAALYGITAAILLAGIVMGIEQFQAGHWRAFSRQLVGTVCAASACCFALWLTYRLNRARYDRALQLGMELGLEPEFVESYLAIAPRSESEARPGPEGWERYR
jgi:hypothetical protein